jgi:hypothetical protein
MLTKCKYDIRGHLSSCHLSWENELILARAGLFDIPESTLLEKFALVTHWGRNSVLFVRVSIQLIHPKRKK